MTSFTYQLTLETEDGKTVFDDTIYCCAYWQDSTLVLNCETRNAKSIPTDFTPSSTLKTFLEMTAKKRLNENEHESENEDESIV